MSDTAIVVTNNSNRSLRDLRVHNRQAFESVSLLDIHNLTALDFPILSFDEHIYPGSPCPNENLIKTLESPHLYHEFEDVKIAGKKSDITVDDLQQFNLDPILENSVDIQELLNATHQGTDEVLEKLILGPRPEDTVVELDPVSNITTSNATSNTVSISNITDCMSHNNDILDNLGSGWQVVTVKTEGLGLTSCQQETRESDLSVDQVTSSTITPPPTPPLEIPRGRPGRKPSAGGPIRNNRKRQPDKGTEEYIDKRVRNNIAVRKSRDKAKQKQQETEERMKKLSDENDNLSKKVDLLTKELNVLKSLFINVGAALPANFEELLSK